MATAQKLLFTITFWTLTFVLSGCRLEVVQTGGGQVVSGSGRYDCEADIGNSCVWDINDNYFSDSFTAVPEPGYRFAGWSETNSTVCGGKTVDCSLSMSSVPLTLRRSLLASENVARLTPVFEISDEILTFNIAGTIGVLEGTVIDSDTNNPDNGNASNDSIVLAQPLGNPGTAGGYLSDAGEGEPGNASDTGDVDDYYRVEAQGGELITLFTADYAAADLDLYLYDSSGEIVEFSAGSGETEQLVIPEAGTWYINPFLYSGASNYIVTIGTNTGVRTGQQIVPGDVLVTYQGERVLRQDVVESNHLAIMKKFSLSDAGGGRNRTRKLQADVQSILSLSALPLRLLNKRNALKTDEDNIRWNTLMLIKELRGEPGIMFAEPNYLLHAAATTNDPYFNYLWHYDAINVPTAWNTVTGDSNVVVAVVDTGIIADHPDLAGQLVDGYDFISDVALAGDGDGIDPDPTDEGEGSSAFRSGNFHGLHVAGTIGATGNNNTGIVGIAYGSKVMPLRALNADGEGTTYDIMQAVRYAAGLENDSGILPTRPATVINLSLGGGSYSASEQNLYRQVSERGVIVVAASGNDGIESVDYPGAYQAVFAVGATDATNSVTRYSNRGGDLDIMAPGGNLEGDANGDGQPDGVLSTYYSDGVPEYFFLEGTSMATPHVAGVMALIKSINDDLSTSDMEALLVQGRLTDDLGSANKDNTYGWGLINAQKSIVTALDQIGQTVERPAQLGVSTSSVNFGSTLNTSDIVLTNLGDGELTVSSAETSAEWLEITPLNVDAAGLGVWRLRANRSTLAEGQYNETVSFTSSAGTATVSISLRVTENINGDIGVVYILFIEIESQETVAQAATWSGAKYAYSLPDLPQGSYEIWAGTDTDNDYYICDAGEACGAWQSIDSPGILYIGSDQSNIEFTSDYQLSLPELSSSTGSIISFSRHPEPKRRAQ